VRSMGCEPDDQGIRAVFPVGARAFCQCKSGPHPVFCSMGGGVCFPRGIEGVARMLYFF
jgi:hypothetical protein